MSEPSSDSPIFSAASLGGTGKGGMERRTLLKLAGLLSLLGPGGLAGCGSSSDNSLFSGGATGGGPGGLGDLGGSGGGIPFSGRVNLQDFGGVILNVQTIQQKLGAVGSDGSFTSSLGGTNLQLVFITQPLEATRPLGEGIPDFFAGSLRGLGLYLPGAGAAAIEFGLNSTALALIFLAFGILTMDSAEATERIRRILALPGYSAFVAYLGSQLTSKSIAEVGNDLEFRRLKQKCIDEFFATPVLGKLTDEEKAQLKPQGYLRAQKAGVEAGKQSINLENHGWRYVTVIRQELDASGNETVSHVLPPLWGSNVGGFVTDLHNVDGVLGGGNTLGWGNLFTGQTLDPTNGLDKFTPHPNTTRLKYWVQGPGGGNSIQLPATIQESEFGTLAYGLTGLYYFLLPLFDLVSGGLAGVAVEKVAAKLFEEGSLEALNAVLDLCLGSVSLTSAADGLRASYKTEQEGNITSGWIDVLAALTSLSVTVGVIVFQALLAEAAVEAGSVLGILALAGSTLAAGIALVALAGIFAVAGLGFALINVSVAIKDHLGIPAVTQLPILLRSSPYDLVALPPADSDGFDAIFSQNLNDSNDALIFNGSNPSGYLFVWQPLLAGILDPARALLGPLPNSGFNFPQHETFINNRQTIVYRAYNNQRYVTMVKKGLTAEAVELNDVRILTHPDFEIVPYGLNNFNQLVGTRRTGNSNDTNPPGEAFILDLDTRELIFLDISTGLGIPNLRAFRLHINDLAQVAGLCTDVPNVFEDATKLFLYNPDGTMKIVVTSRLAPANVRINALQQILLQPYNGSPRLIDIHGDVIRQFALPAGAEGMAIDQRTVGALNDLGQVIGQVYFPLRTVPYLWDVDGTAIDLSVSAPPTVTGAEFFAVKINNNGTIVGNYRVGELGTPAYKETAALLVPRVTPV